MPDDDIKKLGKRIRNGSAKVGGTKSARKVAKRGRREFASAGRYTEFDEKRGVLKEDADFRNKIRTIRQAARGDMEKVAGLFNDGGLGYADIMDSNNPGYYSYEFPVDAMELPASRAEELRFYRLAYDRDPIVGRAIDLHTEIPMSKLVLEKPKCSVNEFADYVFDFYQGLVNDTKMFQVLIQAVREFWTIGEAFLYIEQPDDDPEPCKAAQQVIEKQQRLSGTAPLLESEGGSLSNNTSKIMNWLEPSKRSSLIIQAAKDIAAMKKAGIDFDPERDNSITVASAIVAAKARLRKKVAGFRKAAAEKEIWVNSVDDENKVVYVDYQAAEELPSEEQIAALNIPEGYQVMYRYGMDGGGWGDYKKFKFAKLISTDNADDEGLNKLVTAAPGDPPAGDMAPAGAEEADAAAGEGAEGGEGDAPAGDEGAPMGDAGMDGVDLPAPPMGGGGGGGGMGPIGGHKSDRDEALSGAADVKSQRELMELRHMVKLLQRKKELLEELAEIQEQKREELELFAHIENPEYEGFEKIQVLPPEQVEISNDGALGEGPEIYYKPPEQQVQAYIQAESVTAQVKDLLQSEGKIPLNQDPFQGSYVIHFARKKADYELHGRSILQRCIRTVIYREKLRQVQSTLASRNMTPKTVVIAPGVPMAELMTLRAHIDEAKSDPDYSVVVNYDMQWNEIGSEGRLLALDAEWQHTNSDLAIGLGFSPEILIGEGMYSGNRIQLEILNTTYLQFRDVISDIVENQIFRPIAMKKGFYETDKYGRPRWIYPKVSFSRMALRDSGDLYDMMYNLYSKGSLPVSIILEFLNIDPETVKQQLEDDLFTVNDSKMSDLLSSIYNNVAQTIIAKTDIAKRLAKGLNLDEVEEEDEGMEGSGEGV